jgi:hypothetical protein
MLFYLCYSTSLVSMTQKVSSAGLELGAILWSCVLCSYEPPAEADSLDLGAALLSCLVSGLQKGTQIQNSSGGLWALFR